MSVTEMRTWGGSDAALGKEGVKEPLFVLLSGKCLQHTQVERFRRLLDFWTQKSVNGSELEIPLWLPLASSERDL